MNLKQDDRAILSLIRRGYTIMAELVDITGFGCEKVNASIEFLDQNRFIRRDGLRGSKFWNFKITQKGNKELPVLSAEEAEAVKFELWPDDIGTLKTLAQAGAGSVIISEYIRNTIQDTEQQHAMSASVVKLLRKGYLDEHGFLLRKVRINPKGETLLSNFTVKK
jgi:hypothetical protein